MNNQQELWWEQALSDYSVLVLLRSQGVAPCHQLHYLQMVTEKLAKAYFWRTGKAPPKCHSGFAQFLRSIGGVQPSKRDQVAKALAFKSFGGLQSWIRSILPMAYDLERIAPALANNGPNPEYPWPHNSPTSSPVRSQFAVWDQLIATGRGRQFVQVIEYAVYRFPDYA